MSQLFVSGIDFGGTNIKVAVVDRAAQILGRATAPTDVSADPADVIRRMVQLVASAARDAGLPMKDLVAVGIGAPGPLNQKTGRIIRSANLPHWTDVALGDEIAASLRVPVFLENDANAAAFGESWAGAGRDGADLVLLTLGTGVGAGVVLNGHLLQGHFLNAAELGHMIVVPDGLPCPCGQRGCLEQYASATAVARRAEIEFKNPMDAKEVGRRSRDGDSACLRIWNETCVYLGIACVNIQHAFNPARIVLSGGLANAGEFLADGVRREFRCRTWKLHDDRPLIELAQLGYDAGVIGAAGLAWKGIN
jgi:glucokinase